MAISDKFDEAGKFGNKLWNVSRLCLMNLEGYEAAPVTDAELAFEDRWILSRLATITQTVTHGLRTTNTRKLRVNSTISPGKNSAACMPR